jgi:hypothetical protein
LLFALLASTAAAPGAEIRRDGDADIVRAEADQRTAWATGTDDERLPEFVPGIGSTQALARSVMPSGVGPSRSTVREFEGSYTLAPLAGGRTLFRDEARFEPANRLLPNAGDLIVRHVIAKQFQAMVGEIERRPARGRSGQEPR